MKMSAILIDLDGTLANIDDRREVFIKDKNWDLFYSKISEDKLNNWCLEIIHKFKDDYKIVLMSGRRDYYRNATVEWLKKFNVPYDLLLLRSENDFRPDDVVKLEIYESKVKEVFDILFVVDDRDSVVKMWRKLGLTCLQCAEGNF